MHKWTDDTVYWPANAPSSRIARIRRGKYVRIPEPWRGKVTDRQTRRKRRLRALLKKKTRSTT